MPDPSPPPISPAAELMEAITKHGGKNGISGFVAWALKHHPREAQAMLRAWAKRARRTGRPN